MSGRREPIGGPFGAIGEAIYRVGLAAHRGLYASGLRRTTRLPATVVSVGNLTAGGTGKTPIVAELARRLGDAGRRVAILSRGYGRRDARRLVSVPVGPLADDEAYDRYGDEPCLLRGRLPEVPILLAPDRAAAGAAAIEGFGADLLLLDDGFQHRRLARDRDVVVVRGRSPFGNGRLLPRGYLREPAGAIGRANLVLVNVTDGEEIGLDRLLGEAGAPAARARFAYEPESLVGPDGEEAGVETLRGAAVFAVSGVGHPESFEALLAAAGARVAGALRFGDHHRYTAKDCERIARESAARRARPVTTEKDRVRLGRRETEAIGLFTFHVAVRFDDRDRAFENFVARLGKEP